MKSIKTIILIVLAALWHFVKYICNGVFKFLLTEYKKNPTLLWIPIFLVIWAVSIPFLRWVDPNSGVFDSGVFQIPLYTVILFIVFMFIAWQTIRILFGHLFRYATKEFKTDFNKLQPWEKIRLYFFVFFSLLFALVLLARVLIITPIN